VVSETGSTNADLAELARAGAPDGQVLVAELQTAGRGRLGRHWQAPAQASITCSVLVRPIVPPARLGWLGLLTGVALAEAVTRIALVDAALKWPNDLLVRPDSSASARSEPVASPTARRLESTSSATSEGPRPQGHGGAVGDETGYGKAAGVLAERPVEGAVVIGFGLNVSQDAGELPRSAQPTAYPPTSLALSGAPVVDRDPLLRAVLREFADWYERWVQAAGDPDACGLRAAYRERCVTLDAEIVVHLPGGTTVAGRAADVDPDGRLLVVTERETVALAAGDVVRVR
jgi:BirA family biotin operon repressor/biotin-[acetyl-CoA-carboxylase] ligase